jgi:hypothetical protein
MPVRRLLLATLLAGVFAALVLPTTAHADAVGPTDYRSEVVSVTPATDAVELSIEGGDAFVRIEVEPGHEVIVLGYEPDQEPYLRIATDGAVEHNLRSYATYYNADRYGRTDIPDTVDTTAEPDWERLAGGGAWSWHDHRAHWMSDDPPVGLEPGDALPDQVIDLLVDGRPVTVTVRTTLQPDPSPLAAIVGVLIGLQLGLLAFAFGPATANLSLFVTAAAATVAGAGQYWSVSSATGPLVTWWLLPAIATVSAVVVIAIWGRSELVQLGLLALGGAMLVLWGFRRRDGLGAAVLPTDLPAWFDRLTSTAAPVAGVLVIVTAARALYKLLTPPTPSSAVSAASAD